MYTPMYVMTLDSKITPTQVLESEVHCRHLVAIGGVLAYVMPPHYLKPAASQHFIVELLVALC